MLYILHGNKEKCRTGTLKNQVIEILCEDIPSTIASRQPSNTLIVIKLAGMPVEIQHGNKTERPDLQNSNEEADIMITHQVLYLMLIKSCPSVCMICDDTDVFVLLVHHYACHSLQGELTMEGTSRDRQVTDIRKTVLEYKNIAAHSISGGDTAAWYWQWYSY